MARFRSPARTSADPVVATVGHWTIKLSDLHERYYEVPPENRRLFDTPSGRRLLVERQIRHLVLLDEARKANVEMDAVFQTNLRAERERLLVRRCFNTVMQKQVSAPTMAETEDYYHQHPEQYGGGTEVFMTSILAPNKASADQVQKLLKKKSFASVFAYYKAEGKKTEVMAFSRQAKLRTQAFRPEVEKVLSLLQNGQITKFPIQTAVQWVRKDGARNITAKPFSEVQAAIEKTIINQRIADVIGIKKSKLPVKVNDQQLNALNLK